MNSLLVDRHRILLQSSTIGSKMGRGETRTLKEWIGRLALLVAWLCAVPLATVVSADSAPGGDAARATSIAALRAAIDLVPEEANDALLPATHADELPAGYV